MSESLWSHGLYSPWYSPGKNIRVGSHFLLQGASQPRDGKPRECIKKQRHHFANKGPSSQSCGFSSSHVQMWELNHKEDWVPKNWCFQTVVLEKTLKNPLDCKEIKPVNPKGNQPWIFIGRIVAEAPTLWPPHAKSWLIGKDSDAGRDWGQEDKGTTEDEMAGWHHQLDGRESDWTPGVGDGCGGLACCNSWGRKESDTTEQLNWTELNWLGIQRSTECTLFLEENPASCTLSPWEPPMAAWSPAVSFFLRATTTWSF